MTKQAQDAAPVDLLHGVRVIDFSHVHAGPLCAYQMALMGADVIKVESPMGGDQMRTGHPQGLPPGFLGQNANKRSLAIDLKDADGLKAVHALVASADVVLHNMRPGTPDRLGIGFEALKAVKADLIYCAISGYGQSGPESDRPAYDHLIQGESGMFMATGTEEQPVRVGFAVADAGTAMVACSAINAALLRRASTGAGAFIDVSMLESCIALMGLNYYGYLASGRIRPRVGPNPLAQNGSAGTFVTKDGTLLVSANSHRLFERLAKAVGREDLLADERFGSEEAARANRVELRKVFADIFSTETAAHWDALLRKHGIPAGQLKDLDQIVDNPQLAHRGTVKTLTNVPGTPDGTLRFVGAGFTVDENAATPSRPPPRLGEHSAEVLAEIGYSTSAIAALRAKGVLQADSAALGANDGESRP